MVNQNQANAVMKCQEQLTAAIDVMCNGTDKTRFITLLTGIAQHLLSVCIQLLRSENARQSK